ncbi:hypothetical protein [Nonomuraea cavernae]|uniref:Uncharacterized protein n=1 Tax=Nonomuraea cavernae TaxID=2045107 RepID=A0A918DV35_9ACTN|nr:hypothetical protein [Nonomuraea cavernae]MCA2190882.1 hypothetical protein [Nonomuraea cavernae]GGO83219.1 hypothetical protein GCM10012289_76220 [Nonomuraea cavernae]
MSTDLTANPQATTELHRYAEALLAHLAANGTVPPTAPAFDDIPGDWLPPAVQALVAILAGDDPLEPLSRAAGRDQQRTALFLCLALAVAGHGSRIHASWLGTAFGELSVDQPVTHGQRSLWLAAARGAYGPAGKIFVLRKLDALGVPDHADQRQWVQAVVPGEPTVVVPVSLIDFPEMAEIPELARPAQAAARLARLRARCTEITSTRQAEHDSSTPLTNSTGSPVTAWAEDEPLAVLRSLIGLGGPSGPMASLTSHLLDDLRPGADPHLAAIALHVAAPLLRGLAEELENDCRLTPPATLTVTLLGHHILLRPEGPDDESLAEAEAAIVAEGMHPRRPPWAAILLIVAGVCCLAGAPLTSWLLAGTGAALLGLAGWRLWQRRKTVESDAKYVAARIAELRELADGAVWALHAYAREAEARAKQAADDSAELTRLIRRGPRAA